MDDVMRHGLAMFNALAALKLKRARIRGTREGVEIVQPGKPSLLLTYAAADDFAKEIAEASE